MESKTTKGTHPNSHEKAVQEERKKAQMDRLAEINSCVEKLTTIRGQMDRIACGINGLILGTRDRIFLSSDVADTVKNCLREYWQKEIAEIEKELEKFEITVVNK